MNNQEQPSLKHKVKTVFEVDYNDLEQYIQAYYGHKDYSFLADQECSNDSVKSFDVGVFGVEEYEEEELTKFKQTGKHFFITNVLLEDLCREGKILPGEYNIVVTW